MFIFHRLKRRTKTLFLLAIQKDIPIILCIGYNDKITKETAMKTGVCPFVNKPFSIHELADKIQDVVNKKIP